MLCHEQLLLDVVNEGSGTTKRWAARELQRATSEEAQLRCNLWAAVRTPDTAFSCLLVTCYQEVATRVMFDVLFFVSVAQPSTEPCARSSLRPWKRRSFAEPPTPLCATQTSAFPGLTPRWHAQLYLSIVCLSLSVLLWSCTVIPVLPFKECVNFCASEQIICGLDVCFCVHCALLHVSFGVLCDTLKCCGWVPS